MRTFFSMCTPIIILSVIALSQFSCTKYQIPPIQISGPEPDNNQVDISTCDPDTVYFQNSVLPLFASSCGMTGCHDQASHRHGVILTDYASIITTGKITPGNPNSSELLESLTNGEDDKMPPPPLDPLSTEQIQMIRQWILQGALNNVCSNGCDTSVATFTGQIWPVLETYCTGCHNTSNSSGGIIMADYTDVVALAESGSLMGALRWEPGFASMPMNQQLSQCTIDLFQKWIDDGYPD